jgi:hypothetical protein
LFLAAFFFAVFLGAAFFAAFLIAVFAMISVPVFF